MEFDDIDDLPRQFNGITEPALEALRKRIGVPIKDSLEPWCHEASRDVIRHYAHGIGDDNPLWCDPEYARESCHGEIIAPPSFLFACDRIISGYVGGLPGVHAMWAGADFNWHKHIRRNDEIHSKAWLKELISHETKFSGTAIQQIYHVDFFNQQDELICDADSWCFRTDRDIARERGTKYEDLKEKPDRVFTDDELIDLFRHYADEEIRGSVPRYYDDVAVGDTLPVMAKGPMTVTGFIAFAQGWGGLYIRANKLAWQQHRNHAGLGIKNKFGIPDCPERVHWETEFARTIGAPEAYDYGPERFSWMTHHITNWMGDSGFLVNSKAKIRRHNPVGDFLLIRGEVIDKRETSDQYLVEISQRAENQDGELSIEGTAIVALPCK
ncbi:MAG TPA: MaoC family dehydratase N-terminal domain-containing protein [Pseudomonadales bacterium]|jgi:acyl dehydratase|nr:acyl dehydratase [Gammaproteobacteria bacterium]MDP6025776.1 MaoC family dehydratase N-terminal domain-containing protein [Pseudomonadales bacterium]MDP6314891.1 MaoC family dehydratase N-terminal domain-containing protein [Pseudomonadales bacterium]MDP7316539.1 MaoC family dehydratase N-terminal domain-containing protein [Pseudomonadales bacterium]MDP7575753.1 MaoC family dehydratase N-terminal domain-containing protein [Pseudomonadales bacterium]|tara:strand:- start:3285 stop:4433 length:1149 start_codon:yes stop_codon:yes gene_type:complete